MIDPRFAKLPHEPRSICPPWSYWTSPVSDHTGLPSWVTEGVWNALVAAMKRLDAEPSLGDRAKGSTGCGDDAGPED